MNPDQLEKLFAEALELENPLERARFLDRACGADIELRQRAEKLVRAHEKAAGFLSNPSHKPAGLDSPQTLRVDIPLAEKAGDKIGRYKLLQQIGEGGCGVVYMAEQEEPVRRRVALKVIKLGMDTKSVIARFEAERQALALMDHPNIAKVLDAGATDTGRPYFVMELVRGNKITEFCDENKVSTQDRLKLFIQVCQAIQHAHQKGVIHRDIKPSNILVTINDSIPVPKVIDFGIAKATAGRLTDQTVFTAFDQFIGTPAYMSPEQAVMTSLDIDTRSDIYSLGVLLYELLVGCTPFDQKELLAAGLDEMRRTIREKEPPKPSTRLSTLGKVELTTAAQRRQTEAPKLVHRMRGDLDWIVMKCLEKDRTRRYETANGLATDIARHLSNEPIVAHPPSRLYRFQKSVQRNKLAFGAGLAIATVLVIGVMVSTSLAIRAVRAEREQSRLRIESETGRVNEARMREQAEAGELFAAVELLTLQGKLSEAEARIAAIPFATMRRYPIRATTALTTLGGYNVGHKRWESAISNFSVLIELSPDNYLNFHALLPLLAQAGEIEIYRSVSRRAIDRFSKTTDPTVADRIAKDCLVQPDFGVELDRLTEMAGTAVARGSNHPYVLAFACTKGLAEFRNERYESALEWMQKSIDPKRGSGGLWTTVQASMVISMARFKLNQTNAAWAELNKGLALAETEALPIEDRTLFRNKDMVWTELINAQALMREAKTLIEGSTSAGTGRKSESR